MYWGRSGETAFTWKISDACGPRFLVRFFSFLKRSADTQIYFDDQNEKMWYPSSGPSSSFSLKSRGGDKEEMGTVTTDEVSSQLLNETIDHEPRPLTTGRQLRLRPHGFCHFLSDAYELFNGILRLSLCMLSVHHNLIRLGIPVSLVLCKSRGVAVTPVMGCILVPMRNLSLLSLLKSSERRSIPPVMPITVAALMTSTSVNLVVSPSRMQSGSLCQKR
mmetsp:Transcript_6028/g.8870  ORF Transcript_6028/g.8870 Transcript_6028/m.8870 type:complete len:219 (-) Transcript_6028:2664-3320(-)